MLQCEKLCHKQSGYRLLNYYRSRHHPTVCRHILLCKKHSKMTMTVFIFFFLFYCVFHNISKVFKRFLTSSATVECSSSIIEVPCAFPHTLVSTVLSSPKFSLSLLTPYHQLSFVPLCTTPGYLPLSLSLLLSLVELQSVLGDSAVRGGILWQS